VVSKNTVSKACNEKEYIPRQDAIKKILKAIRKVDPASRFISFFDKPTFYFEHFL
jgi:hypothetical protein